MCLELFWKYVFLIFITSPSLYIYGYLCENKMIHVWFSYEKGLILFYFNCEWMLYLCLFMCHIGYYLSAFLSLHFVAWMKMIWLMRCFYFVLVMVMYVRISWYMFDFVVRRFWCSFLVVDEYRYLCITLGLFLFFGYYFLDIFISAYGEYINECFILLIFLFLHMVNI